MHVFSKKIITFINNIKADIKEILSKEIRLKVYADRFYDREEKCSYPIKVAVFNHKNILGYYDPDFYELGFHESLMYTSREQLKNIIRHELAHMIIFINYGHMVQHHGPEFRTLCKRFGWGEEVYMATTSLEGSCDPTNPDDNSILRKVQKLMALASSSNQNEAEQAMIKSQQLLMKHNIESKYLGGEAEEKFFTKRLLEQKKENAKMRAIAQILETFFVNVIYTRSSNNIYVEVMGNAVNIEIAEYVANFLDDKFDHLWDDARSINPRLKGMVAKNSFFLGLARGYCNKVQALRREYSGEVITALIVLEKMLVDAQEMIYPRLRQVKSSGGYCSHSSSLGEQMGRQLNINPALGNGAKNSDLALGYSR